MGSYMTKVAKMLGVEIGEVFKIDSKPHCLFRFTHKCLQVSVTPGRWLMGSDDYLRGFLNGSLSICKLFGSLKRGKHIIVLIFLVWICTMLLYGMMA